MKTKNTIMRTRSKETQEQTEFKWIGFLQDCKANLDGKGDITIKELMTIHSVSNNWQSFLISEKAIFKNNNKKYEWNQSIDINKSMLTRFRKFTFLINRKYKVSQAQQELPFIATKTRKKKENQLKLNYTHQEKQIGLIRKFLKWIY